MTPLTPLLCCVFLLLFHLSSVESVRVGARHYQNLALHTAAGSTATGTAADAQSTDQKEEEKATVASSTGSAPVEEEETSEPTETTEEATGAETTAEEAEEAAVDEKEEKEEAKLESNAEKTDQKKEAEMVGATGATEEKKDEANEEEGQSGAADTGVKETNEIKEDSEAATGAEEKKDNDDEKGATGSEEKEEEPTKEEASASGPKEDIKAAAGSEMEEPSLEDEEADKEFDDMGPDPEVEDVGAASTGTTGAEEETPTGGSETGSSETGSSETGSSETGSRGTGGTGGEDDDAPTGPAPTLDEPANEETKKNEDTKIEVFGDGVKSNGEPVDYAEIELILSIKGLPCKTINSKNKRFRPSVSLAVTGDVKNHEDVLVTDTFPLDKKDTGCRASITLKVNSKGNALETAKEYGNDINVGKLRQSIGHYFPDFAERVTVQILQTPRVLAGNTASNAAMERQKAIQDTNAAMYGVGESTADELADHKYSSERPHVTPSVQRLYRQKHLCKDTDCVLKVDELLNDALRANEAVEGSGTSDDSEPVEVPAAKGLETFDENKHPAGAAATGAATGAEATAATGAAFR